MRCRCTFGWRSAANGKDLDHAHGRDGVGIRIEEQREVVGIGRRDAARSAPWATDRRTTGGKASRESRSRQSLSTGAQAIERETRNFTHEIDKPVHQMLRQARAAFGGGGGGGHLAAAALPHTPNGFRSCACHPKPNRPSTVSSSKSCSICCPSDVKFACSRHIHEIRSKMQHQ